MTSLSHPKTTLSVDQSGNIIYFNDLRSERSGMTREMKGPSVLSPKESSVRWFILVVFSVFALLVSSRSDAQDVYNFYFQKNAPVPVTTTNATATPPATATTEPALENKIEAAKPVAKSVEEKNDFRRWEMMLSYAGGGFITNEKYTDRSFGTPGESETSTNVRGTGFMTSYRFNKFVSVDGAFYYLKTENVQTPNPYVNGAMGLMVTPLHINIFGYELIEFGVGAGIALTNKLDTEYNAITGDVIVKDENRIYAPYVGTRLAINFVPQLAAVADVRSIVGGDSGAGGGLVQIGMRYRF
jgi:hypothetical protein